MSVSRTINGRTVVARPVFKGAALPAYWVGAVNDRPMVRTFPSAHDVFRFVEHNAQRV
jgi:gamma-glutamylcysteine synthetase